MGEGGIWVCDEYGIIENGDYITSSNYEGYGCAQDDDLLHNYTVAKATIDCDFTISFKGYKPKKIKMGAFESFTSQELKEFGLHLPEDDDAGGPRESDSDDEHYAYENSLKYVRNKPRLDPSGNYIYETCYDSSGNVIYEEIWDDDAPYKCKEITIDGKVIRVAFIACTFHCG